MAQKLSRNSPCPCGSGKKYKQCCIRKGIEWLVTDDGSVGRRFELSGEAADAIDQLQQAQLKAYGRLPKRLFDGAPPLEVIEHMTVEAMKKAGVEPALIYAFEQTGLMVNEQNERQMPDVDLAEWEAAIDAYEKKTGQKATRRRMNQSDLLGILKNGPKK